jgi:hypothetical protein
MIDVLDIIIISFFTGMGSAFGIELSKYIIGKLKKKKGEILKAKVSENHSSQPS